MMFIKKNHKSAIMKLNTDMKCFEYFNKIVFPNTMPYIAKS